MTSLLEAKKSLQGVLLQRPDVVGVGLNYDTKSIRVYVNTDDVKEHLDPIPPRMAGFPIEIIQIPNLKQLSTMGYRGERYRPVVGGVSASHPSVTAGTVGAILIDGNTGNKLLLSNNHVFANCDSLDQRGASIGDPIYQPGVYDGGTNQDIVATLMKWIPFANQDEMNIVDAALALPTDQSLVSPYILADPSDNLVQVQGVRPVSSAISVKKYSRTTDVKHGKIVDWDFTVAVEYEDGRSHNFTDQILVQIETEGGDSGSVLLDNDNYVVGLIFAGGTDAFGQYFGVANKIRNVLAMLGGNVDIMDGLSPAYITEPKPTLIVQDVSAHAESSDASDQSVTSAGMLIAGIGAVGALALWQHLNKRKIQ